MIRLWLRPQNEKALTYDQMSCNLATIVFEFMVISNLMVQPSNRIVDYYMNDGFKFMLRFLSH